LRSRCCCSSRLGARGIELTIIAGEPIASPTPRLDQLHYRIGGPNGEASSPVAAWRTNDFVEDGRGMWRMSLVIPAARRTIQITSNEPGYHHSLFDERNYLSVFLRKTFVVTNRAAFRL